MVECPQVKCAGIVSKINFSSKFLKSIQKNLVTPIFKEKGYTMRQQYIGKEMSFLLSEIAQKSAQVAKNTFF